MSFDHCSDPFAPATADMAGMPMVLISLEPDPTAGWQVTAAALEEWLSAYPRWARVQTGVWLVRTHDDPARMLRRIQRLFGAEHALLIIEITDRASWSSLRCSSDWLAVNLPQAVGRLSAT